jgi:hypothetical protein
MRDSPLERGGGVCYASGLHTPATALANAPPLKRGVVSYYLFSDFYKPQLKPNLN